MRVAAVDALSTRMPMRLLDHLCLHLRAHVSDAYVSKSDMSAPNGGASSYCLCRLESGMCSAEYERALSLFFHSEKYPMLPSPTASVEDHREGVL